jgi:hypothetical protein
MLKKYIILFEFISSKSLFINYHRFIEKLVKGQCEREEIEFDKLSAPIFPI